MKLLNKVFITTVLFAEFNSTVFAAAGKEISITNQTQEGAHKQHMPYWKKMNSNIEIMQMALDLQIIFKEVSDKKSSNENPLALSGIKTAIDKFIADKKEQQEKWKQERKVVPYKPWKIFQIKKS